MSKETRETGLVPGGIEEVFYMPKLGLYYDPRVLKYYFAFSDFYREFEAYTPNSSKSREWKSFEHYKRSWVAPTMHALWNPIVGAGGLYGPAYNYRLGNHRDISYGYESSWGPYWSPLYGLPIMYDSSKESGFIPPPVELAALEQRALKAIMPSIKAELSSINSLIELKDIVSIKSTVRGVLKTASSIVKKGYKSLRQVLRGSADVNLQTQFNVLPLLSDIAGIRTALSRTEKRVRSLAAAAAKPRKRYFTVSIPEFETTTSNYGPYSVERSCLDENLQHTSLLTAGSNTSTRFSSPEVSKFVVVIEYNYHYTQYQIEHARLLGLLDAFGVNFNPAIIWNAIPWSFVVDWVFGVSRYLDSMKTTNLEPVINIRRYSWSILRQRRTTVTYVHGQNGNGWKYSTMVPVGTVFETAYRRSVGMPNTASIVSSGVTLREFTLGASLVLTRRRRRR